MISYNTTGNFKKTLLFLERSSRLKLENLSTYAQEGVDALASATPVDSGLTADSWYYKIIERDGSVRIDWLNSNLGDGWAPIALLIQYGHATGTGGYVEGIDYINPALKPIFDKIEKKVLREVTSR